MTLKVLSRDIGSEGNHKKVVLKGICSFWGDKVTFRQLDYNLPHSIIKGQMVSVQCEGCHSILEYCLEENKLYPSQQLKGLQDLPPKIQKYYDVGLRCISSDCPNGVVTLFRKAIHAIGIHYNASKINN